MHLIPKKLHSFQEACVLREQLRETGKRVVLTNGCFDLLHVGHVCSLESAAKHGDSLWVALNSDHSIKSLKGISRPIFTEINRAYTLSALECISGIFIFNGERLADEILLFKPDAYVKSGDYDLEKLDKSELRALRNVHAEIKFVPFMEGMSTSTIISAIKKS
ncbi:MAG: adenylyltransferase/cytidyltransferase family protein [Puniceicoccales bacterium]|jgi:rfaE bifunctional protein nucleotidyltransferase chain/domain|nr:adenylyltransferase/cytidyltransferase family protein [Puniceicoccales bacterium]